MGDNSQNNVDSDPRSRYNLRERKQITSTVTSQDQQLAQLSDVENSRKRKRIESSTRVKNKPARKLTFLDLPPEVRNEIYTLVLYARPKKRLSRPKLPLPKLDTKWKGVQMTKSREKDLRNFQRWQMEVAAIVDPIDGRPHYTSQFSPGLYSPCGVFAHNYRGDKFKIDTLWHKDPALWQVSRQIRQEARSLHVAKSVSFDVRGTDRMLSWSQDPTINSGLSRFEHWFTKMLDDDLQRGIMRLELCDYVQAVASPVRMVADQLAGDKFYRFNGGFVYDFIPAF